MRLVTLTLAREMDLVALTALRRAIRYRLFLQVGFGENVEEREFLCMADWDQSMLLFKRLGEV